MNPARADWPFLEDAWRFALVLTGREEAAAEAVRRALADVLGRTEAGDAETARRLVFARIFRNHHRDARRADDAEATAAEEAVRPLHLLSEPGRSALALLAGGQFSGEALATLLSTSEGTLARALEDARADFEEAAG